MNMIAMPGGKAYLPITKVDKDQRLVYGYASTPALDYDGDTITLQAITGAVPGYMQFGNIREMHQMSAVGVAKSADIDDKGLYLCAKIVDDDAWNKVKEGVYKGFSIGGNATSRDPLNKNVITGLELVEISVVDRPACPEALIDFFKVAKAPEREEPAKPSTAQMRDALLKVMGSLPAEEIEKAFTAAELEVEPEVVPVAKAADPEAAPAAVDIKAEDIAVAKSPALAKEPAVQVAERILEADDKEGFIKAVQVELDMTDDQMGNITSLNKNALTRWLANNETMMAKAVPLLEKSYNRASKIAAAMADIEKPDPGLAGAAMAKAAASIVATDVTLTETYADPGFQSDKALRFPLTKGFRPSVFGIKGAWTHINKARNQAPYTAEQVELIKGAITTAWKAAIDKEGPPLAKGTETKTVKEPMTKKLDEMGPDAKGDLRKGLMAACSAIRLLADLNYLTESLEAEAAVEADGSPLPARFGAMVSMFAEATKNLLDEEIGELLTNDDAGIDYPVYIAYADKATELLKRLGGGKVGSDLLIKSVGDKTDMPGYSNLIQFAEDVVAKAAEPQAGDWPAMLGNQMGANNDWGMMLVDKMGTNNDWVGKAQDIMDLCVAKGAMCKHDMEEKAKKDADMEKVKNPPKPAPDADEPATAGKDKDSTTMKAADPEAAPAAVAKAADPAPAAAPASPVSAAVSAPDIASMVETLTKTFGTLLDSKIAPVVKAVDEINTSRRNPDRPASRSAVVDKAADVVGDDKVVKALDDKTPADPMTVLKGIRETGARFVPRNGGA